MLYPRYLLDAEMTLCNISPVLFERCAEKSAHDEFAQFAARCTGTIQATGEAEPGIDAQHATVFLDCLHDSLAFADGTTQRFLTPNVFAGACSGDGHKCMPMGWGWDVNDVDVRLFDELAPIAVSATVLSAATHTAFQAFAIDVANRNSTQTFFAVVRLADATTSDNALSKLLAGRRVAGATENVAGNNG